MFDCRAKPFLLAVVGKHRGWQWCAGLFLHQKLSQEPKKQIQETNLSSVRERERPKREQNQTAWRIRRYLCWIIVVKANRNNQIHFGSFSVHHYCGVFSLLFFCISFISLNISKYKDALLIPSEWILCLKKPFENDSSNLHNEIRWKHIKMLKHSLVHILRESLEKIRIETTMHIQFDCSLRYQTKLCTTV